ncbi:MAG: head-tail adaptor protein [Pseudomonadota bacterium]
MHKPVMNTELILEEPKQVADGGGGYQILWSPIGTLWAEVKGTRARERAVGGREISEHSHQIVVRSAPDGSPRRPITGRRFRSGSRVFQIFGTADYDDKGRYLTCWTKEAVTA